MAEVGAPPAQLPKAEEPCVEIGDRAEVYSDSYLEWCPGVQVEVFSESWQAWCPGVVQSVCMDSDSVVVAYQVPTTDQDSKISSKTLPMDSPEVRAPSVPCAYVFGATVEIFCHSHQAWCPARIQDVTDNVATVCFHTPDMAQDTDPIIKSLPIGHEDLRLFAPPSLSDIFAVGSPVEVFCNCLGVWCPGHVHELRDGLIVAAFHYPDMEPSSEPVVKELPLGHQDLRLRIAAGCRIEVFSHSRQFWCPGIVTEVQVDMVTVLVRYPDLPPECGLLEKVLPVGDPDLRLLGGAVAASTEEEKAPQAEADVPPVPLPKAEETVSGLAAAPAAEEPAIKVGATESTEDHSAANGGGNALPVLKIGRRVDVFSNACQVWCPGIVQGLDPESVVVEYQVPTNHQDSKISSQTFPIGAPELRAPAEPDACVFGAMVELFIHSHQVWCPALVRDVTNNVATVCFSHPDMAEDSDLMLESVPIGHEDLRPFAPPSLPSGHDSLDVESPVEVFSNSLGVWCPGYVHELRDGLIVAAFHYPDMDPSSEPVVKDYPLGHQDLRLRIARGCCIEVFSHSRQCWCPAVVKKVREGMVTVVIRHPELPPGSDMYKTRRLPVGDPDLRLGWNSRSLVNGFSNS